MTVSRRDKQTLLTGGLWSTEREAGYVGDGRRRPRAAPTKPPVEMMRTGHRRWEWGSQGWGTWAPELRRAREEELVKVTKEDRQ